MTDSLGTVRAELALKTIYYLIAADGDEILDRIDEENMAGRLPTTAGSST